MSTNPGERFPKPTAAERATKGTIFFFHPILDALVFAAAFALAIQGFVYPALIVAFIAGRIGAR